MRKCTLFFLYLHLTTNYHIVKNIYIILFIMAVGVLGVACQAKVPKGKLIYCSYARTGAAGLGKNYCELIADPGTDPIVRVVLNADNRFDEPEVREEYPTTAEDVASLQEMLESNKVYKLNGYNLEEPITGGYSYRIYMEYDSDDRVEARWYGHKVKDQAIDAYNYIEYFFKPWRDRAVQENNTTNP